MDKSTFIYLLIETVLFLIPIITLAVKLGGVLKVVKGVENFPEWKASMETKVKVLEENDKVQNSALTEMNKTLVEINSNVKLLLEGKIRIDGGK